VRGDRSVEYGAATVRRHPHAARRAEILEEFPEVAELFGGNRWSAVWTAALVAFQLASAVWVTAACPVWVAAAASYCVGAVVDHALFVLSHDGTHNLILGTVTGNRVVMLLGNVPHVIPSAMFFHYYHKLHHSELKTLNDPEHPFPIEARVVGTSPLRKSVWLALFFVVQSVRTAFYTYRIPRRHDLAWVAVNFAVNAAANAAILRRFGVAPLVYLVASVAFSLGLHPLGARWIQEHYPTQPYQATYSYYGRANRFAFNVGHHVEHHDFSSVAWNRLPELRRIAAPYYDTLHSYSSYTRLLLDFIFDRRWSIGDRISVEQDYAGAVAAGAVDTTDPFSHRVRTGAQ
jgi:sphingolipid 4-desaturase/C4-monooxygenase